MTTIKGLAPSSFPGDKEVPQVTGSASEHGQVQPATSQTRGPSVAQDVGPHAAGPGHAKAIRNTVAPPAAAAAASAIPSPASSGACAAAVNADPTHIPPAAPHDVAAVQELVGAATLASPFWADSLEPYAHCSIPPRGHAAPIVFATRIFDGIGDVMHLLEAVKHVRADPALGDMPIALYVQTDGDFTPQQWHALQRILVSLRDDYKCTIELAKLNAGTPHDKASTMAISHTPVFAKVVGGKLFARYPVGRSKCYVPEYLPRDRYDQRTAANAMSVLSTGVHRDSAGVWMDQDPIFSAERVDLSDRLRRTLFGVVPGDGLPMQYQLGFAAMRNQDALEAWMVLHATQTKGALCCVAASTPMVPSDWLKECVVALGFTSMVIVDEGGAETVVPLSDKMPAKNFRFVNCFLSEEDKAAVIQYNTGSMGASGDTSSVHALQGRLPPYFDADESDPTRDSFSGRIRASAVYLGQIGYDKLEQWYDACLTKNFHVLLDLAQDPVLQAQWARFSASAKRDLDIKPHFLNYVRRSMMIEVFQNRHPSAQERLFALEGDLTTGAITMHEYQSEMRTLVDTYNRLVGTD